MWKGVFIGRHGPGEAWRNYPRGNLRVGGRVEQLRTGWRINQDGSSIDPPYLVAPLEGLLHSRRAPSGSSIVPIAKPIVFGKSTSQSFCV